MRVPGTQGLCGWESSAEAWSLVLVDPHRVSQMGAVFVPPLDHCLAPSILKCNWGWYNLQQTHNELLMIFFLMSSFFIQLVLLCSTIIGLIMNMIAMISLNAWSRRRDQQRFVQPRSLCHTET